MGKPKPASLAIPRPPEALADGRIVVNPPLSERVAALESRAAGLAELCSEILATMSMPKNRTDCEQDPEMFGILWDVIDKSWWPKYREITGCP